MTFIYFNPSYVNFRGIESPSHLLLLLSRGCPAHSDGRHVVASPLPGQRRPHYPAILTALPLYQHVAVQQAGDGRRLGALLPLLGGHHTAAAEPHRGLGREAGAGAGR